MQLNRSTDYAIQMLVYLAKNGQTLSSTKLAASLGISYRYLLKLVASCEQSDLLWPSMDRQVD